MLLKILKKKHPTLRKICKKVEEFTPAIQKLGMDMLETMIIRKGIGLAGNQVGKELRIITVDTSKAVSGGDGIREIMVNPEITKFNGEQRYKERCLSLPGVSQWKNRHSEITVEFQDLTGCKRKLKLNGLNAVVVQHEIDHLQGKLIIDEE